MQFDVLSDRSILFHASYNVSTNLCQAKNYIYVIYILRAFHPYAIQVDTSRFSS